MIAEDWMTAPTATVMEGLLAMQGQIRRRRGMSVPGLDELTLGLRILDDDQLMARRSRAGALANDANAPIELRLAGILAGAVIDVEGFGLEPRDISPEQQMLDVLAAGRNELDDLITQLESRP